MERRRRFLKSEVVDDVKTTFFASTNAEMTLSEAKKLVGAMSVHDNVSITLIEIAHSVDGGPLTASLRSIRLHNNVLVDFLLLRRCADEL